MSDKPKLRPEVEVIIERQSKIDWSSPLRDEKKVVAAYCKRLKVTKLQRQVRWVGDPEDARAAWDARDAWAARDVWAAWDARDVWAAWDARDAWAARAARAAWAARDARAAWDARDAWAARAAWAARDARDARAAWDARDAWAARAAWDAIGYLNLKNGDVTDNVRWLIDTYSPMIDAFEGGAFYHILGEHEIVVVATPDIHIDDNHELHREDGPALEWPKTKVYYWHGVEVPKDWIEDRENIDPNEVIKVENVEQRAVGASIIGWANMLDVLDAKVIHDSGSNDIGQLIELTLPGLPEPGRFLKAYCPRNGIICEGVPYKSDIDGLPIDTALAAQAWRVGDPLSDYQHPTKRT